MYQIVMLGAGHLGELLLEAWLKKKVVKRKDIAVVLRTQKSAAKIKKKYKVDTFSKEKAQKIPEAKTYIIAVRPKDWPELKNDLLPHLKKNASLLSIMAGTQASDLEKQCDRPAAVALTNTGAQVGKALTSVYFSPRCKGAQKALTKKLFQSLGPVFELKEESFYTATALGGSQPAFILWILAALEKILTDELKLKDPRAWMLQVFEGALALSKKEKDISKLITQIATPGGCTQEGLNTLQELKIDELLREVITRCSNKAEKLALPQN